MCVWRLEIIRPKTIVDSVDMGIVFGRIISSPMLLRTSALIVSAHPYCARNIHGMVYKLDRQPKLKKALLI